MNSPSSQVAQYVFGAGNSTQYTFQHMRKHIADQLRRAPNLNRGQWQTLDVSGSPQHSTRELINYTLFYEVPDTIIDLQLEVMPDLPWAEQHFAERVGRVPVNPPPSHVNWPGHGYNPNRHISHDEKFSHTYPERFWPRHAGVDLGSMLSANRGIYFEYGDLDGVVEQLIANPYTRQAILPVWFPEDTGATNRRVPCTIAYHFMCDSDMRLHMWYYLRACDFVRHFHNDVYFASRLLQWVIKEVGYRGDICFRTGRLNMTISSLHVFQGDMERLP